MEAAPNTSTGSAELDFGLVPLDYFSRRTPFLRKPSGVSRRVVPREDVSWSPQPEKTRRRVLDNRVLHADNAASESATSQRFANHPLKGSYDFRTVQERLGHNDVNPTMIDTHVLNREAKASAAPWTADAARGAFMR